MIEVAVLLAGLAFGVVSYYSWVFIKDDVLLTGKEADIGLLLVRSWPQRILFVFCGLLAVPTVMVRWVLKRKWQKGKNGKGQEEKAGK